jgi:hypothetical protein
LLNVNYVTLSPDNETVKVYELEVDATSGNSSKIKATERNLVNGKWEESIKVYEVKDYYRIEFYPD